MHQPQYHTRGLPQPVYVHNERRGYSAGGLALGVAGGVVAGAMLEEVLDDDLL